MSIKAKFAGTCKTCHAAINIGEIINWQPGAGATHVACKKVVTPGRVGCADSETCIPYHDYKDPSPCLGCKDAGKKWADLHADEIAANEESERFYAAEQDRINTRRARMHEDIGGFDS